MNTEKLRQVAEEILELADKIDTDGADVLYEVEFVGGTQPVDTPQLSAGHLAADVDYSLREIVEDYDFQKLITDAEEADEAYLDEYQEAVRDLDIRR